MDLTLNPIWQIYYDDVESPKTSMFLSEAQTFVAAHDVRSITVLHQRNETAPGKSTAKDFGERQMTKDELNSLTPAWLEETIKETAKIAHDYFTEAK